SGKVVTKTKTLEPTPGAAARKPCSDDERKAIDLVYANRTAETVRCINAHVCQGNSAPCSEAAKPVSLQLRALARDACHDEVLNRFCDGATMKGALTCSDDAITMISSVYQDAFSGDSPRLRRCLR